MSCEKKVVLNDTYEFNPNDRLGKGAFGTVYKGKVIATGEIVAVKALPRSMMGEQNSNHEFLMGQLRKEINLMGELSSEHVVRIIDLAGSDTHIYLILEYCAGGDLRNYLDKQKEQNKSDEPGISEEKGLSILKQVLEGFKLMASHGYVHRDIKPENILITSQQVFKIADFGFATKVYDANALELHDCVGSPLYMSPQLLQQKPYSSKSDIWAIGLLYYEILYGNLPWICRARDYDTLAYLLFGVDINTLLLQIKKVPVRFPLDKTVSIQSKEFIKGCLQLEETKRFGWDDVFAHPLLKSAKKVQENILKIDKPKRAATQEPRLVNDKVQKKIEQAPKLLLVGKKQENQITLNSKKDKAELLKDKENIKGQKQDLTELKGDNIRLNGVETLSNKSKEIKEQSKEKKAKEVDLLIEESNNMQKNSPPESLDQADQKIIMILQDVVQFYNVSPKDLFNNFDKDEDTKLSLSEFIDMLRKLDKSITMNSAQHLFEKISDSAGFLSFEQFLNIANEWKFYNQDEKNAAFINKIHLIVKDRNIDLEAFFKAYENEHPELVELTYANLEEIIKSIAPKSENTDIQNLYKKLSKYGKVLLSDFRLLMIRQLIQETDTEQSKKIAHIIKELRSVLISKNIASEQVFKNFSARKSGMMMKLGGLKKLVRILDESIDDNGIAMLFRFMDVDSDGEISLDEFKAALEV